MGLGTIVEDAVVVGNVSRHVTLVLNPGQFRLSFAMLRMCCRVKF